TRRGLFPLDAESFPSWPPAAARREGIDMTSGVTDTPRSGRPPAASGVAWHTLGAGQVLQSEGVDRRRALSSAEAAARAQRSGPDTLAAGKAEPRWHAFVRQYHDPICTAVALSVVVAAEIRKRSCGGPPRRRGCRSAGDLEFVADVDHPA